jgi:hypothetical protein
MSTYNALYKQSCDQCGKPNNDKDELLCSKCRDSLKNYYPCGIGTDGKINKRLTYSPMTRTNAENYLKLYRPVEWRKCEAIPQLANNSTP